MRDAGCGTADGGWRMGDARRQFRSFQFRSSAVCSLQFRSSAVPQFAAPAFKV
jgi:hypothetical protein